MPIKDKEKDRQYHIQYYKDNKQVMLSSQKARWKRAQEFIKEYKMKPCIDCGFIPEIPDQMDFDHISGNKITTVARMVAHGCYIEDIKKEINKCELICANCHRLRTYKRRELNSVG